MLYIHLISRDESTRLMEVMRPQNSDYRNFNNIYISHNDNTKGVINLLKIR